MGSPFTGTVPGAGKPPFNIEPAKGFAAKKQAAGLSQDYLLAKIGKDRKSLKKPV